MLLNYKYFARVYYALFVIIGIILIGTLGYMIVEGWTILDSFYMTIQTVSTVGFNEAGQALVNLLFNEEGGDLFAEITGRVAEKKPQSIIRLRHVSRRAITGNHTGGNANRDRMIGKILRHHCVGANGDIISNDNLAE